MTQDMMTWWPIYWSMRNGYKPVPYPLMLLWHHANILPRC